MRSMLVVASALVWAATAVSAPPVHVAPLDDQWSMGGHDYRNSRSNPRQHVLNPRTVDDLATKWLTRTHGDVSATPGRRQRCRLFSRLGRQMRGEGASNAGPAIVNDTVYWGNGYARNGFGAASTTFYAFHTPRH